MKVIPISSNHYYNKSMEGRPIDSNRGYFNYRLNKHVVVGGCHSGDGATLLCEEWDVEGGDLADNPDLIYYGCERTELWPTEMTT